MDWSCIGGSLDLFYDRTELNSTLPPDFSFFLFLFFFFFIIFPFSFFLFPFQSFITDHPAVETGRLGSTNFASTETGASGLGDIW